MSTARTEPSEEPWRVANDWNPYQGTEEPTYVFLQNPDEKPEYMTRCIDRNWRKWEANIEPILIAAEEEERRRMKRLNSEINMMTEDSFEELKMPESETSSPVKAKEEMTPEQVLEDTIEQQLQQLKLEEARNKTPISYFNYQPHLEDILIQDV